MSFPADKLMENRAVVFLHVSDAVTYILLSHVSLGKANFYASWHAQLHHLCCVIQDDILDIYYSSA